MILLYPTRVMNSSDVVVVVDDDDNDDVDSGDNDTT